MNEKDVCLLPLLSVIVKLREKQMRITVVFVSISEVTRSLVDCTECTEYVHT